MGMTMIFATSCMRLLAIRMSVNALAVNRYQYNTCNKAKLPLLITAFDKISEYVRFFGVYSKVETMYKLVKSPSKGMWRLATEQTETKLETLLTRKLCFLCQPTATRSSHESYSTKRVLLDVPS